MGASGIDAAEGLGHEAAGRNTILVLGYVVTAVLAHGLRTLSCGRTQLHGTTLLCKKRDTRVQNMIIS